MGVRGVSLALLLLLTAVSLIVIVPHTASAAGPTVTNISWYPVVPARGENVTVYADISSAAVSATVQWCVIPPFTCRPFPMFDPDHNGRWNTSNVIDVVTDHHYTGADFNVTATDAGGNTTYAAFTYVQFGDGIQVNANLNTTSVAPGGSVSVSGATHYQYLNETGWHTNISTPAWNSNVRVKIVETGVTTTTSTNGTGGFATTFTAPQNPGSYTVNVTVTNRTLAGSWEQYLAVSAVPTPDLAVLSSSFTVSPSSLKAGDTAGLSFIVENRGNGNASDFTVRLTVKDASSAEVFRHDFTVASLQAGMSTTLETSWTAVAGDMTVNVTVDPGGLVTELSKSNNYGTWAVSVAAIPPEGLSTTLIAGLTILIVGVAVAAALVLLRRRRSKGPQQPDSQPNNGRQGGEP